MNFDDNTAALQVIRFINGTNKSVFLTGKAGTGKTTLLKTIVEHTHKSIVIVAPTGIAALNAGGVTIHSMLQLPPACYAPALDFKENEIPFAVLPLRKVPKEVSKMAGWKRNVIKKMELLVIDEVSMLRADLLDAIDTALRSIRRQRNLPFGGVQVLYIGDMLQLPPIVKNDEWNFLKQYYNSMYFFDAHVLKNNKPLVLELEKIYRQDDKRFIEILNNLRNNTFVPKDVNELNKHYIPDFEAPRKKPYIFITTHNKKAEAINDGKLRKLKTQSIFYHADILGTFPENLYPINPTTELKEGAQIMFIKNDFFQGEHYYNGKIGEICKLEDDKISVVYPETGQIVDVDKYTWENV
ncbi:MAG: AAA family ATPase, partial [Bacteroidales bacterium]|nr:AAA family ATPase [Bacteroidales bacterium]